MARDFFGGKARRKALLGAKLDRATATLPASTYGALFNIIGGRVILTSMVGEVTTIVQTQACNLKITATATTGDAVDVTANLDVGTAPKAVGCLLGIGVFAAATIGANAGATTTPLPVIVPIGTLGLTTSATNTGSVKWSVTYMPYDDGAMLVSA